jgi:hypothetical protein
MEDEKRVTFRMSGPLYRVLNRQAEQEGVKFSEYVRRLLVDSYPHLAVLADVGKILEAGKGVATQEEYLPYLLNCEKRLEKGLADLQGFEKTAAELRAQAEAELTACLAHIRQRKQQFEWTGELLRFFQKTLPGEGEEDEHGDQQRKG